jgi:tol-pal system protein YbgF
MKKWIILGVGALLFGCATSKDVQILDEDIRRFQSQLNLMQKEEDGLKRELSAFQKKNQDDIPALQTEIQRVQTDLHVRLENLQSEVRILSTGVEEYKELLKKPFREIDRVKGDMESRLRTLEEREKGIEEKNRALEEKMKETGDRLKGLEERITGLVSKLTEMEKSPSIKEVSAEVKGVSTNVGDLYKDAYETFQKGNLEGARRKFEAFLKQYPNTELSDNAQFWIGETYYLKKDFEKAILEYEKAIVKYPEGDKIPAALFKQALAFLELGDKTNARNLLKRVIERYPHSEQAEMAKKRLEAIK